MVKIMISLLLGFVIGYKNLLSQKGIKINGRLQTVWLLLLIFSMGLSIGADNEIVSKLPVLGWKGLVFAVFSIAGSIMGVYIMAKIFFEKEEKK